MESERQAQIDKDRVDLIKAKEKSEDDYEKNITYISAGTLVLSLTFVEKIVNLTSSIGIWWLISSWVFMGSTLIINLISHQFSVLAFEKTIDDLASLEPDINGFKRRSTLLDVLNWSTLCTLLIGIICLITFCSLNALKMSEKHEIPSSTGKEQSNKGVIHNGEQKGRKPTMPSSFIKPQVPTVHPTDGNGPQGGAQNSGGKQVSESK